MREIIRESGFNPGIVDGSFSTNPHKLGVRNLRASDQANPNTQRPGSFDANARQATPQSEGGVEVFQIGHSMFPLGAEQQPRPSWTAVSRVWSQRHGYSFPTSDSTMTIPRRRAAARHA